MLDLVDFRVKFAGGILRATTLPSSPPPPPQSGGSTAVSFVSDIHVRTITLVLQRGRQCSPFVCIRGCDSTHPRSQQDNKIVLPPGAVAGGCRESLYLHSGGRARGAVGERDHGERLLNIRGFCCHLVFELELRRNEGSRFWVFYGTEVAREVVHLRGNKTKRCANIQVRKSSAAGRSLVDSYRYIGTTAGGAIVMMGCSRIGISNRIALFPPQRKGCGSGVLMRFLSTGKHDPKSTPASTQAGKSLGCSPHQSFSSTPLFLQDILVKCGTHHVQVMTARNCDPHRTVRCEKPQSATALLDYPCS